MDIERGAEPNTNNSLVYHIIHFNIVLDTTIIYLYRMASRHTGSSRAKSRSGGTWSIGCTSVSLYGHSLCSLIYFNIVLCYVVCVPQRRGQQGNRGAPKTGFAEPKMNIV